MTIARATPPEAARGSGAALAVLLMAPFLAQADATIANVATPAIRLDLVASAAAVELVIGGYLISFAVLLIIGARLGQARGSKCTFQLGIIVFGAASLGGGLAPNATVLILMRIAQGAGAALMFPQALTGIQQGFTGALRTRAIGLYALALSAGAVIGQVLGGVLVSADVAGSGWRPILLVNVPICAAVALAAHRYLPADAPRRATGLDVRGAAVLAVAVLLIVIPLTLGTDLGWPVWLWVCLVASVPALWLFWAGQRRAAAAGRAPLVNVGALATRPVVLALVTLAVGTGTYYALLFTLAQYVQSGLGRSALASGLILVPWVAAFGLAGQITRRLPARLGPHLPVAGYLLLAAVYTAIGAVVAAGRPNDAVLVVLLALGGLGLGTGFATLIGHLAGCVPTRYASDISGVITTVLQIGGAIGVASAGGLYLAMVAGTGQALSGTAFAATSTGLGGAALLAAATAFLSTHRRTRTTPDLHRTGPTPR